VSEGKCDGTNGSLRAMLEARYPVLMQVERNASPRYGTVFYSSFRSNEPQNAAKQNECNAARK